MLKTYCFFSGKFVSGHIIIGHWHFDYWEIAIYGTIMEKVFLIGLVLIDERL
jgi:hypothetical protein